MKKRQLYGVIMFRLKYSRFFAVLLLFVCSYFIGGGISLLVQANAKDKTIQNAGDNWGLGFSTEGQPPTANATADELKKFDAYYIGDTNQKVIYLTFDAGYENGYTPAILDALKKHNVPATFFIVGNYMETSPDLVKRMVDEGHTVANHTYHHPDMSKISSMDSFKKEIEDLEVLYQSITGKTLTKFYRPPQGKYNESNLKMAQELGYHTFFWSLAYVDWYVDKQPTKEEAFKKTSRTNSSWCNRIIT